MGCVLPSKETDGHWFSVVYRLASPCRPVHPVMDESINISFDTRREAWASYAILVSVVEGYAEESFYDHDTAWISMIRS